MATKSIVEAASAMALGIGILLSASPANALPRCVNTSNYTTQCESNGNSQITTFPGPVSKASTSSIRGVTTVTLAIPPTFCRSVTSSGRANRQWSR